MKLGSALTALPNFFLLAATFSRFPAPGCLESKRAWCGLDERQVVIGFVQSILQRFLIRPVWIPRKRSSV